MTKKRDVVEYMRESNESQKKKEEDVTVYAYERKVERVRKKKTEVQAIGQRSIEAGINSQRVSTRFDVCEDLRQMLSTAECF